VSERVFVMAEDYAKGLSLSAVGRKHGVSRQRVHQILQGVGFVFRGRSEACALAYRKGRKARRVKCA